MRLLLYNKNSDFINNLKTLNFNYYFEAKDYHNIMNNNNNLFLVPNLVNLTLPGICGGLFMRKCPLSVLKRLKTLNFVASLKHNI